MAKHNRSLNGISLAGLTLAPPQVLGGVRLVPLTRSSVREDLRLSRRAYSEDVAFVEIDQQTTYVSYVPHGLVANWSTDGSAVFGSQIADGRRTKDDETDGQFVTARGLRKMARREGKQQLRFLPMHVAMEGLLALHFGGPSIAWTEYSSRALRSGLSPRWESAVAGESIRGLEDALRLFEVHENQVGALVFVADALASAFVVPHPADYLSLHHTLVSDFYGELIWQYGLYGTENIVQPEPIDIQAVSSINELCDQVAGLRRRWAELSTEMTSGLLQRDFQCQRVYRFKPFTLERFISDLEPKSENHIGEAVFADNGTLQYLKTYRLSAAQTRRAYLLERLADCEWSLTDCANSLACSKNELILRLENNGFGYLLHQHVIDAARAAKRR
ncbi:MAG: hypothetical protein AAFU85_01145 [Planctomycetota bacterium]